MLANYHTHTALCRHATGMPEDYCREAIRQGVAVLGFTDHAPYPDGRWSYERMSLSQLPEYCRLVDEARVRHSPSLTVLKGLECEYVPECLRFQKEVLLGERRLDYLILGNHYVRDDDGRWLSVFRDDLDGTRLHRYTDALLEAMRTGIYACIAHPDVFGARRLRWDEDTAACSRAILEAARQTGTPLELNTYGFRKAMIETPSGRRPPYPLREFWEMAAGCRVQVLVNTDAHRPEDVWNGNPRGLAIARRLGLHVVNEEFHRRFLPG